MMSIQFKHNFIHKYLTNSTQINPGKSLGKSLSNFVFLLFINLKLFQHFVGKSFSNFPKISWGFRKVCYIFEVDKSWENLKYTFKLFLNRKMHFPNIVFHLQFPAVSNGFSLFFNIKFLWLFLYFMFLLMRLEMKIEFTLVCDGWKWMRKTDGGAWYFFNVAIKLGEFFRTWFKSTRRLHFAMNLFL